jgi:hypothetical protein
MQTVSNPLFIEDLAGNSNEIKRGSIGQRRIRVKNLGERIAEIDIWIAATDNKSESLLSWCTFSEQNPLKIDAKSFKEVTLNFQLPLSATPELYNYEILVEAATQYPGKICRRPLQLRVLPSDQDAEWGNEPGFTIIQPITNSANPLSLQAQEQLEVKIKVENRSKRVDRFYLSCPEFTKEWYSVRYPEIGLDIPGLVKETDGLELNPGSTGEINLILHPPQYTPAGNYFPTIRLISSNKEDLVLLDVVYLKILSDDRLDIQMHPLSRKVPTERGEFEIELTNRGNIQREFSIRAHDEDGFFNYLLQPKMVQILPGEKRIVVLKVKPRKWWRRHWRGKGLSLTFAVELENIAVGEDSFIPALPKNLPQGNLVWQSHPWWKFWLLILLCLGSIGLLAFAIWWNLLRQKTPPPLPQVMKFETTANQYQEAKDDAIRLNWQIRHFQQLEKVTVIRLEKNVEIDRKNYLFKDGIPQNLQPSKNNNNGICESKNAESNLSLADKKAKEEASNENSKFNLFSTLFPSQKNVNYQTLVLNCKDIITNATIAGDYTFKIEVYPKQNSEQVSSEQTTDTIQIIPAKPLPPPKITDFSPTKPIYQEVSTVKSTKKITPIGTSLPPIHLNWNIVNPNQIKELKMVGLGADGSITSQLQSYLIINNQLPEKLKTFCTISSTNLKCRNFPTDVNQAGNYTFKMTIVCQNEQVETEITKTTDIIKILPKPATSLNIISFKINGEEVSQKPKHTFTISKIRSEADIAVSWQVADGEDIKIEILPAPGVVSSKGSLAKYPLSKPPSSETITLKVTNKAGEQTTQSVLIETVEPSQTQSSSGNNFGQTASGSNSSTTGSAIHSNSAEELTPVEFPPVGN